MHKIRDILRLSLEAKLTLNQIALAVRMSKSGVRNCLKRFKHSGMSYPLPAEMTDTELENSLYPPKKNPGCQYLQPDWARVITDLSKPHVTLELLYQEYLQTYPEKAMSRSSFYRYLSRYRRDHLPPVMRMRHKGGEKLFVDYSGDSLEYVIRETGEIISTQLFIASWGASSYSFAEATHTQALPDWIASHNRAYAYFGCVARAEVPDNTKTAVSRADFYDPDLNPLYAKLARHYGFVVLPARVRKPKDKAVVESNVLHLQRFILGRLRDRTFFSLDEINQAIRELLEEFNSRPMKMFNQSRRQRFEELDKPFALALPAEPFRYTDYKAPTVAPDYHVEYGKHFYSVPYTLIGQKVDLYRIDNLIEIYHDTRHVYRHKLCADDYQYSTVDEHMPPNHRYVKGWSQEFFIHQAQAIGPAVTEVITATMRRQKHPEQGYRSAMGILALIRQYSGQRLELACQRALHFRRANRAVLLSILKSGLDARPIAPANQPQQPRLQLIHGNIRGAKYYAQPQQLSINL
jgi:transposase